jgi:trigger factor
MPDIAERNKVSISDAGPSRKKISIEIPAGTVTQKVAEQMDTLTHQASLPGFRPGKVPRGLIERRFGPSVRQEAKSQLVSAAYSEAVKEHKLKVLGDPVGEGLGEAELTPGKPFAFDLEVEVMPEFDLPELEGIQVRKPTIPVTDEMVAGEVEKLRINEGSLESRETPEPGDYLTGKGVMTGADGTEFYNIDGAVIQVPTADRKGKGMILGILVEDFEKQLGRPVPGQTVTIKAKGPANHEVEGVRNADLTVTFKVDRVDRIIPAPVEDLTKRYGFEGPEQLTEAVRRRMDQRVAIQQQSLMRNQVARHLVRSTTINLPERLTAAQAARALDRRRMELMYRGVDAAKIEEHIAELRADSKNSAARELKLNFILASVAERLKVQVSEAEINGRIAQMAQERSLRPEKLRQELIQNNRIGSIFSQIREHKSLDALIAKAVVTEVTAEEFDKQMKDEREAGEETAG